MTREDIIKTVNSALAEEFEVEENILDPEANIKETLSLDSLSLVDLVALIQQTYKVKIPVARHSIISTITSKHTYPNDKGWYYPAYTSTGTHPNGGRAGLRR